MSVKKVNSPNKKPRNLNFSPAECNLLEELVEEYTEIINCKKTGQYTKQQKDEVWDAITDRHNAESKAKIVRTSKQLQMKYKNLKYDYKKEISRDTKSQKQTGGGSYMPSTSSSSAHGFGLTNIDIVGVTNEYDSNANFDQLSDIQDPDSSVFI